MSNSNFTIKGIEFINGRSFSDREFGKYGVLGVTYIYEDPYSDTEWEEALASVPEVVEYNKIVVAKPRTNKMALIVSAILLGAAVLATQVVNTSSPVPNWTIPDNYEKQE